MNKFIKTLIILSLAVLQIQINIFAAGQRRAQDEEIPLKQAVQINQPLFYREFEYKLTPVEAIEDQGLNTDQNSEVNKTNDSSNNNSESTPDNTTGTINKNPTQSNGKLKVSAQSNINNANTVTNGTDSQAAEDTAKKELPSTISVINSSSNEKITLETILTGIGNWWVANSLAQQIWYVFFLTGLILYIYKLKQLRRPLLFSSIVLLGFYLGSSLDPIGAIFNIIPKHDFYLAGSVILLGVAVLLSLLFGRIYCGWICPIGAVQEFIYPELKRPVLPSAVDALLKYLKYIVLVVVLSFSWRIGNNLWENYEPLKTLVHFGGSAAAILVLIVTLIISVLIERPFCRYICPLGAILSITSRIAPFKMRADANNCMVCGKCSTGDCAMNAIHAVNPVTDLPQIEGSECISCLRCQRNCQRFALRISLKRIDHIGF